MPYKSEIIHGINSTNTLKCYQSALTQRKHTVTLLSQYSNITPYLTVNKGIEGGIIALNVQYCLKCIV